MQDKDFRKIISTDLEFFKSIFPNQMLAMDPESLSQYGSDETEDLSFPPEVVVFPTSVEQISQLLRYCNQQHIPVTARGAGTGLSGGALPVYGGVSLSLEKMNRILNIDERNFQVTVEPGVITQVLQETVAQKGLFYPPDPASKGSCFIGGNLAENSGGPKAVKYGVTKDYVLNLEVVLANGDVIWTGANVLKNATGYNLTQLLVGSEGTLGIITKAVIRLLPHYKFDKLMLVPFYDAEEACEAVSAIFHAGVIPSGLEFIERDALDFGKSFVSGVEIEVEEGIDAHLLIEVDGNDEDQLMRELETIGGVMEKYKCGEILLAETASQKDQIWKMRRSLGEAVKSHSIYKEEDTVVPRAELPKLLKGVKEIGAKYQFRSVCYGHAGDGNLHVNILKEDMDDHQWNVVVSKGIEEIFALCVSLGGTISGEHGIGWVQKTYMPIAFKKEQLAIQQAVKKTFDPNGILNPGKIFV